MKKILLSIALFLLVFQSNAQLWSVQLNVNPTTLGTQIAGVGWTGTEFWGAQWNSGVIYTADINGNSTGSFTIAGVTGTRSITTDGTYMYIGANTSAIYQVDPNTKQLISTINTSVANCRYLTYDPTLNNNNGGFWTGAYGSDITAVSMSGATLSTISSSTHGLTAIYGMAFDGFSTGGPFLWAFDQGGNGIDIHQLSINGVPTGVMRDASVDFQPAGLAGGLFICDNFMPGTNSMIGISQGEALFSYELADPPADDAILMSLDIDNFIVQPSMVDIKGTIKNGGLNTINNLDIKWSDGTNVYTDNLTGLNIPMNGTYNFTHNDQFNLSNLALNTISVWIEYTPDLDTTNNSLTTTITGVNAITTRRPLVETFTSSTCPPCSSANVTAENLFAQNPGQITSIKYQVDFPGSGDPYYTAEAGNRRNYYSINSVPRMEIDGQWDENGNSINQQVLNFYKDIACFLDITADYSITGQTVDVNIILDPLDVANYFSNNLKLQVAIIEETTFDNVGTNGETKFEHVMKKMVPTDNGTNITLVGGVQQTHNLSYTFNGNYRLPSDASQPINHATEHSVEDFTNLMVVIWVQDETTKEVYQSAYATLTTINIPSWDCSNNSCIDPGDGSGFYSTLADCEYICGVSSTIEQNNSDISIFPNPVKDIINIYGEYSSLSIKDIYGKAIMSNINNKVIDISTLKSGIYFIDIKHEKQIIRKKITKIK